MLKFSEYLNKNKEPESILSWDGSFASTRHLKKDSLKEHLIVEKLGDLVLQATGKVIHNTGIFSLTPQTTIHDHYKAYDKIHDHPKILPKKITNSHRQAIINYANTASIYSEGGHGSSHNINNYLRNRSGNHELKVLHHSHEKVKEGVEQLSSAFTPENTNRVGIQTFSGIPNHIGEQLEKSPIGSKHTLAGFTSTSTDYKIATEFANQYLDTSKTTGHLHMLVAHVEPGAGLSVVHHSPFNEDEILLHHGAHITYRGSETNTDDDGNTMTEHYITVHPTHKHLDEYEPYTE